MRFKLRRSVDCGKQDGCEVVEKSGVCYEGRIKQRESWHSR